MSSHVASSQQPPLRIPRILTSTPSSVADNQTGELSAPGEAAPTEAIASEVAAGDLPANVYSLSPLVDIAVIAFPWENLAAVGVCAFVAIYNFYVMIHNQNLERMARDHPDQYEVRGDALQIGGLSPFGWISMLLCAFTAVVGLFTLYKTSVTIDKAAQRIRISTWAIPCVCLSHSGEFPVDYLHFDSFVVCIDTRGQKVRFTVSIRDADHSPLMVQRTNWIPKSCVPQSPEAHADRLKQAWLNYLTSVRRGGPAAGSAAAAAAGLAPTTTTTTAAGSREAALHHVVPVTGVVVDAAAGTMASEQPATWAGIAVDPERRNLLSTADNDDEEELNEVQ